jgi:hypothetical protein
MMHQNNVTFLLDDNALFLLGNIVSQRISICLKEEKKLIIKKKVSEESCFQRKQRARTTTSVCAFLANESTALSCLGQPEAGKKLQNRPFDLTNGKRRFVFFGPMRSKAVKICPRLMIAIRYCKQLQTFPKAVIKTSHRALDRFLT